MKRRFTEDTYRREPWFRSLTNAMLANKSEEDMANFLRDIGTLSELKALSERLEVAKQLAQGLTYRQISRNTGASTTTVTRVAQYLENGTGGYRKVLRTHRHHRMKKPEYTRTVNLDEPLLEPKNNDKRVGNQAPASHTTPRSDSALQKYLNKKKEP